MYTQDALLSANLNDLQYSELASLCFLPMRVCFSQRIRYTEQFSRRQRQARVLPVSSLKYPLGCGVRIQWRARVS